MTQNHDDFDFLEGDFGFDEESNAFGGLSQRALTSTQRELRTLKLLREAIQSQNSDDAVMRDFAECVLPSLLRVAIGWLLKGSNSLMKNGKYSGDRPIISPAQSQFALAVFCLYPISAA